MTRQKGKWTHPKMDTDYVISVTDQQASAMQDRMKNGFVSVVFKLLRDSNGTIRGNLEPMPVWEEENVKVILDTQEKEAKALELEQPKEIVA